VPESFRGGCSFGARSGRDSPARDRLMADLTRLTAGGIVAVHHKEEGGRVNAGEILAAGVSDRLWTLEDLVGQPSR